MSPFCVNPCLAFLVGILFNLEGKSHLKLLRSNPIVYTIGIIKSFICTYFRLPPPATRNSWFENNDRNRLTPWRTRCLATHSSTATRAILTGSINTQSRHLPASNLIVVFFSVCSPDCYFCCVIRGETIQLRLSWHYRRIPNIHKETRRSAILICGLRNLSLNMRILRSTVFQQIEKTFSQENSYMKQSFL